MLVSVAAIVAIAAVTGEAHKPITSPYTFSKDVLPIVREECGPCHVDGGVAPMSLMTAADATPWAESIRTELIAGRMPPWPVDSPPGRLANDARLTGRELNVLLTWATGGTPPGDPVSAAPAVAHESSWPLGKPDLELMLDPVAIPANQQELVKSFVVATGTTTHRQVRAVDLLPGTPAVVRSARVEVQANDAPSVGDRGEIGVERTLAVWEPGEPPVPLESGAGFDLPAGARLEVQVRYRKTWQYEGKAMQDRSRVGVYFAQDTASPVRAITLRADVPPSVPRGPLRILAIHPDPDMAGVRATVDVVYADRTKKAIFAMRADPAWARRYWFTEPIAVPADARWTARFEPDKDPALLMSPTAPSPAAASPRGITLDVVSGN